MASEQGFPSLCPRSRRGYYETKISPAANADRHAEVRTRLKAWANGNKITSIFGHIHYQEHDGYYWNDGCGVHVGSIECIEMVNDELGVRVFKS